MSSTPWPDDERVVGEDPQDEVVDPTPPPLEADEADVLEQRIEVTGDDDLESPREEEPDV